MYSFIVAFWTLWRYFSAENVFFSIFEFITKPIENTLKNEDFGKVIKGAVYCYPVNQQVIVLQHGIIIYLL